MDNILPLPMSPSQYKILAVDDEEDIPEILEYNLRKEGFEVYTASNGEEAIKIAKEVIPDLIISIS